MELLYTPLTVSMAEFQVDPQSFIDDPSFQSIAVQRDNASTVYVVKPEIWESFKRQRNSIKE